MSESQESFKSAKPSLKDTISSIRSQSNTNDALLHEATQAQSLDEVRNRIKEDYPQTETSEDMVAQGDAAKPFKEVSRFDRLQQKTANGIARVFTSRAFVPDYTDGKGKDDHTEVAHFYRFTLKSAGGPPTISSIAHFFLKFPLEFIKRKIGY